MMTVEEVALISGFSKSYIRTLIAEKKIKAQKYGKIYLMRESVLTKLVRKGRKSPRSKEDHGKNE